MNLTFQYLVVVLAVLVSAWVVLTRQLPGRVRRLRVAIALPLVRAGRPGWVRKLGRWVAPAPERGARGCNSGCTGCGPS